MKMRMTNVPFQTPRFSPLVPNSTRESLSIMEKNHAIDLTGFVIMCLDVWYGKTSNFSWFTRCGVDVTSFRVMDWSKNLGVICNDDTLTETTLTTTIREWDAKTRKDIEVEFIDVDISDINDMINWLRIEKDIFYAPPKDKKADEEKIEAKIEELEEKLRHAASVEVWYRRTNRELVMERDSYRDICEEKERDLQEWAEWFDKVCEELDTPERDPEEVFSELRGKLIELDALAEFKAKLAEVIKLPEDKKRAATTEDYISSFEHTKKEWRKMEIKLENYEREVRLLNAFLDEKKKELGSSNGAMDVLRSLHGSVIGLCDINDCPQIIGARIIDKFNRVKKEKEDLKTDYANAKCARAELAQLYRRTFDVDRLDPDLSPHEIAVQIRKRIRELEQHLNSIRDIYDRDIYDGD